MRAILFYLSLPIIAIIGLRRPFFALTVYLCANIIRPEMLFWGGNTGSLIFRVSLGTALLGFILSQESKTQPFTVRELWLVLWISVAVSASLIFADLPLLPRAWYYTEDFYKLVFVAYLLLGLINNRKKALQLTDILLLAALLLALWGWDQSFRGNERLEGLGGQAFGDSNAVAAFGVLFLPLGLHKLCTAKEKYHKLFGLVACIIIAGMIVFTQSRGGFLGLCAGCIYLLLISPKRKILAVWYLMVLLIAIPLISSQYFQRISTIEGAQGSRDYSSASRLVLWRAGWMMFLDQPLTGVGLLNFAKAKTPYRDDLADKFDPNLLDFAFQPYKVGHSTWFCQMLAEGGLFLAVPMLWMILGFFVRAHKLRQRGAQINETDRPLYNTLLGLEAGILGHCVSISFIDALISPFLTVQILLGVQIIRVISREVEASPSLLPQEV